MEQNPDGESSKLKPVLAKAKRIVPFHSSKSSKTNKAAALAIKSSHNEEGKNASGSGENQAYDELFKTKKNLVLQYEEILSKTMIGAITVSQAPILAFSGLGSIQKHKQMEMVLKQKIKGLEDGSWKLKFKGHELLAWSLVKPVVGVVQYESNNAQAKNAFATSHDEHRNTLKMLYVTILDLQLTTIYFLSKGAIKQTMEDAVKWKDWTGMLAKITTQDAVLKSIEEQWRDINIKKLDVIGDEARRIRKVIEDAQNSLERSNILAWLSSIDRSNNYNYARSRHTLSTGDCWLRKIKLSDGTKQSTESMLRSIIKQLCARRPDIPGALLSLRRYHDVGQEPPLESLQNTFKESTLEFERVYVIINALDEYPSVNGERKSLLGVLENIKSLGLTNLHFLYTGRDEPDISVKLELFVLRREIGKINLESKREEVNADIRTYIEKEIVSSDFGLWPSDIKTKVKKALTEKANGMFQYVVPQLKALETPKSPSAVEEALANLPDGLDQTYSRALLSINQSYWPELAEASRVDPKSFALNSKNPGLRLAHFSVKEFLLSDRIRNGPGLSFSITAEGSHMHIAESCLLYHMDASELREPSSYRTVEFPLLECAATSWVDHVDALQIVGWPSPPLELIDRALNPGSKSLQAMIQIWYADTPWLSVPWDNPKLSVYSLCYIAYQRYLLSLSTTSVSASTPLEQNLEHLSRRSIAIMADQTSNNQEAFAAKMAGSSVDYGLMLSLPTCSLRDFWHHHPSPSFDELTVLWSLKQMNGFVHALHLIHDFDPQPPRSELEVSGMLQHKVNANRQAAKRFSHDMVSPYHIFCFDDTTTKLDQSYNFSALKIADFGFERLYKPNPWTGAWDEPVLIRFM
ncbi:hypothetical protein G7Y89_g2463 [Cudoniella acicularis]|uniref:Nephrocystin 3-like N-terminal domain-containing protein n=1 Tax=Cudoniella acicularis TaxID=354080 RepID=A0A8H4RUD6_9HELO|nr:hypothetical protein G7Y89_g2463 [Cudoniella acicularis]